MSNRLEREFPTVHWQAALRRVDDRVLVHTAVARGRRLQGEAIRRGGYKVLVAVARALAAFIRCGAYGIAKRPPEHDCRPAAKHGA